MDMPLNGFPSAERVYVPVAFPAIVTVYDWVLVPVYCANPPLTVAPLVPDSRLVVVVYVPENPVPPPPPENPVSYTHLRAHET